MPISALAHSSRTSPSSAITDNFAEIFEKLQAHAIKPLADGEKDLLQKEFNEELLKASKTCLPMLSTFDLYRILRSYSVLIGIFPTSSTLATSPLRFMIDVVAAKFEAGESFLEAHDLILFLKSIHSLGLPVPDHLVVLADRRVTREALEANIWLFRDVLEFYYLIRKHPPAFDSQLVKEHLQKAPSKILPEFFCMMVTFVGEFPDLIDEKLISELEDRLEFCLNECELSPHVLEFLLPRLKTQEMIDLWQNAYIRSFDETTKEHLSIFNQALFLKEKGFTFSSAFFKAIAEGLTPYKQEVRAVLPADLKPQFNEFFPEESVLKLCQADSPSLKGIKSALRNLSVEEFLWVLRSYYKEEIFQVPVFASLTVLFCEKFKVCPGFVLNDIHDFIQVLYQRVPEENLELFERAIFEMHIKIKGFIEKSSLQELKGFALFLTRHHLFFSDTFDNSLAKMLEAIQKRMVTLLVGNKIDSLESLEIFLYFAEAFQVVNVHFFSLFKGLNCKALLCEKSIELLADVHEKNLVAVKRLLYFLQYEKIAPSEELLESLYHFMLKNDPSAIDEMASLKITTQEEFYKQWHLFSLIYTGNLPFFQLNRAKAPLHLELLDAHWIKFIPYVDTKLRMGKKAYYSNFIKPWFLELKRLFKPAFPHAEYEYIYFCISTVNNLWKEILEDMHQSDPAKDEFIKLFMCEWRTIAYDYLLEQNMPSGKLPPVHFTSVMRMLQTLNMFGDKEICIHIELAIERYLSHLMFKIEPLEFITKERASWEHRSTIIDKIKKFKTHPIAAIEQPLESLVFLMDVSPLLNDSPIFPVILRELPKIIELLYSYPEYVKNGVMRLQELDAIMTHLKRIPSTKELDKIYKDSLSTAINHCLAALEGSGILKPLKDQKGKLMFLEGLDPSRRKRIEAFY